MNSQRRASFDRAYDTAMAKFAGKDNEYNVYYPTAMRNRMVSEAAMIPYGIGLGAFSTYAGIKSGNAGWAVPAVVGYGLAGVGGALAKHYQNNIKRYENDEEYRKAVNTGKKEKIVNFWKKTGVPAWLI